MNRPTCNNCGHWRHSHLLDKGLCEVWTCECDEYEEP